jgi:tricorn protease-like protein
MNSHIRLSLLTLTLVAFAISAVAVDVQDTKLLSDPAITANHIAFAYANDLWIARLDGSDVRRLTSHPGEEHSAAFSPDGSLIAFTGNYDGNEDVFIFPATGGVPKRLTWHPGADVVLGFTPDGTSVLFRSQRDVHTSRFSRLFTVPIGSSRSQATLGVGSEVCQARDDLALRRACGLRVPRRDRHGSRRKGRSSQHLRECRGARSLARLVARRQVHRLVLRLLG